MQQSSPQPVATSLDELTDQLTRGAISRQEFVRRGVLLGAGFSALGAILAATGQPASAFAAAADSHPAAAPLIGFLLRTRSAQSRWVHDQAGFLAEAHKLGVSVVSQFTNQESASEQFTIAQSMIAQGIKVLVVISPDPTAAGAMVAYARAKGVQVVAYDAPIPNADIAAVVMRSNVQMGQVLGKFALKAAPAGNYVIVNGDQTTPVAVQKAQGVMSVLGPSIKSGKIKIVSQQYTPQWSPTTAQTQVETAISRAGGKLAAVVASNDGMAEGVFAALKAHGLEKKVYVTGEDCDLARLQLFAEGYPGMSGWTPILDEAATACRVAAALAQGKKPPKPDMLYNDGGKYTKVPAYLIPVKGTDRSTIYANVISIGYYSCSQVYGSLPKSLWPKQCPA